MKAFFSFLQTCAVVILIPFVLSNWLPLFYSRTFGLENTVAIVWWSLAGSAIVFASCMWWALDSWAVQRPWAMGALLFGSVMGLMNYGATLLYVYDSTGKSTFLPSVIGLPSHLFQAVIVAAMVMNYIDIKRLGGQPRPN